MICLKGAMRKFNLPINICHPIQSGRDPESTPVCLANFQVLQRSLLTLVQAEVAWIPAQDWKRIWLHLIFLTFRCWNGWNLPWIYKKSHWISGSNPNPKSVKGTDGGFSPAATGATFRVDECGGWIFGRRYDCHFQKQFLGWCRNFRGNFRRNIWNVYLTEHLAKHWWLHHLGGESRSQNQNWKHPHWHPKCMVW